MFFESTRKKGLQGEHLARVHLKAKGFKILESNFNTKIGEIDIIAKDRDTLVFVEVKTAKGVKFGSPLGWIPEWKQKKIIRTSQVYLKIQRNSNIPVRFDVIAIESDGKVCHIQDAFRPRGEIFM